MKRDIREIKILGDITDVQKTLECILPELAFEQSDDAKYCVTFIKGEMLQVQVQSNAATITYASKSQLCRALSHFKAHMDEQGFNVCEQQEFKTIGLFLTVTPAVIKPEKVKWTLRKMALMGMNFLQLYSENTYEIPDEPYFGYMFGPYSYDELKDIDDYAYELGIEVTLNIQTLGHLERVLHWPAYKDIRNTHNTLLVGEDATYEFIEKEIRAAMAPLRTKRINLGMDEAPEIVEGVYKQKHGRQEFMKVMKQHVERVVEITKKLGYEPMMFSDLYFDHAFGFYYEKERDLPQEVLDHVVPGIQMYYWDYYSDDEAVYDHMFKLHRQMGSEPIFGGGIYTWFGPFPDHKKTIEASVPGLMSAKKNHIQEVIATNWAPTTNDVSTILYGAQLYAEFCYTGEYNKEQLDRRYEECCQVAAKPFLDLEKFDHLPGDLVGKEVRSSGSPKRAENLLYEDPMAPLFEKDFAHIDLVSYFDGVYETYMSYAEQNQEYQETFQFAAQFGKVLHKKCIWRLEAPKAVREKDRAKARELIEFAKELWEDIEQLRIAWRKLWCHYSKPYGFEMNDIRIGGVQARLRTAIDELLAFADGEIDDIEQLSCEKLPFSRFVEGAPDGCVRKQSWHQVASVHAIYRPPFL